MQFVEYHNVSITICDIDAKVVYQNDISKRTFGDVLGRSLFDCHPPKASEKIRELLSNDGTNVYTISKKGLKKMIYQTSWKNENGEIKGLIEYSMVIPEDMPHYVRN
ncbi:MAG: PAS sensor protein [Bacteroidales bacterium]|nr:MAG: PAS sensor protein [Bacteroidales bacterium]